MNDTALSTQTGGDHYKKLKIQPIEYITANNIPYKEANIIKYVTRHKDKNGVEDIKKIIHYCQLILEMDYGYKEEEKESSSKGVRLQFGVQDTPERAEGLGLPQLEDTLCHHALIRTRLPKGFRWVLNTGGI